MPEVIIIDVKNLISIILVSLSLSAHSQIPIYEWVGGDTVTNAAGSLRKTYVGPRQNAASWQDDEDNYYIFGGEGYDSEGKFGLLNDFWKYDRKDGVWEYLSGDIRANSVDNNENALSFDGADDFIQIDGLIPYRNDFTWEIAFNKQRSNRSLGIISLSNSACCYENGAVTSFGLYLGNDNLYYDSEEYGTHLISNTIKSDTWQKISMSVQINENGTEEVVKFYLNGKFINSLQDDFDLLIDDTDTTLMATMVGRNRYGNFKGLIDEVIVWNYAKTEKEIEDEWDKKVLVTDSRLTAFYDFNQGIPNGDNTQTMLPDSETKFFSRGDSVDYTLTENQWRLSPDVKITRENDYPLFNYATTSVFNSFDQPFKTEWAIGTTEEAQPNIYDTFYQIYLSMFYSPEGFLNNPVSLFLPEENRYFDVEFSQYTEDPSTTGVGGGGGFAVSYSEVLDTIPFDSLVDRSLNSFNGKLQNFTNRAAPYFKGDMAQLRVWNVARTETEISNNLLNVDPETAGLVAYFGFNDGIAGGDNTELSQIEDSTSNNFIGDIIGFGLTESTSNFGEDILPSAGEPTGTLNFDGLKDNIEIPGLAVYKENYTIETWFKTAEDGTLFSWSPPGSESFWAEGGITFFIQSGGIAVDVFNVGGPWGVKKNGNNVTDDQWHHVAFSIEQDISGLDERIRIYIDGVLENESFYNFSDIINDGTGNFTSKIGFTNQNFPFLDISFGGLLPNSSSNWVEGKNGNTQLSRSQSFYISDEEDNLWMFGGKGIDEFATEVLKADLRKFNFDTKTWDLISGTESFNEVGAYGNQNEAAASNHPGARVASNGWITNDSIFIFGGEGFDKNGNKGFLGDLWLYDIGDDTWTWLAGADTVNSPGNRGAKGVSSSEFVPEARKRFSSFRDDDGVFWLFGGQSSNEFSNKNDLWKYNPDNQEWTWVDGGAEGDEAGSYSALGTANASNQPGARSGAQVWYQNNKLWLFGGLGIDVNGQILDRLNDFWSYDFESGLWTWVGGPNFSGNTGNYGDRGTPSTENIPGARENGNSFFDQDGNLVMFGGYKFTQGRSGAYNDIWNYNLESKEWTWLEGLNQTGEITTASEVGALGEGSKLVPKARNGSANWVDNDGNFWLYGGNSNSNSALGMLNDLWKYDVSNDFWAYYGGSAEPDSTKGQYGTKRLGAVSNVPRSRWHGNSWYAKDGKLWFFGGIASASNGTDIVWLNDLWSYDPIGEIYTWESGSSQANSQGKYGTKGTPNINNTPGARSSAASWTDEEGSFWLFGGYESFEYYNDLWKFNPVTKEWTWISGRNSQNIPGSYGEQGMESSANEIGSRRYIDSWVDTDGNFWIFGGQGKDETSQLGVLNDLWRYNPESNQWSWIRGGKSINSEGHYGTIGVSDPGNDPPARYAYSAWTDNVGNFWLFGGVGVGGWYNDLWRYDVRTNEWTWFGGGAASNAELGDLFPNYNFSAYGTKGIGDSLNVIGNRERSMAFENGDNSLWLFGGRTASSLGYNDLWKVTFVPGTPYLYPVDSVTKSSFTLHFDEAFATSYTIQLSESEDLAGFRPDLNTRNRSIVIGDLEPATEYFYRIKAVNEEGESDFSNTFNVLTLPSKPVINSISKEAIAQDAVEIDWQIVNGTIVNYVLQVSSDSTFSSSESFVTGFEAKSLNQDVNRALVDGLDAGKYYYSRIKAVNNSGSSEYSELMPFITKPNTPELMEASILNSIMQSGFELKWNPVSGVFDNYVLRLAEDMQFESPVSSYDNIKLSNSESSFNIEGLLEGKEYYVFLMSENSSGLSESSDTIKILTRPLAPIFNSTSYLSEVTQTSAVIEWNIIDEIFNGYEIEISSDFSFSNENLFLTGYGKNGNRKVVDKSNNSDTVKNLQSGNTYYARVRAFNSSGPSNFSNIVSVQPVPLAPSFNSINNITQTSASINWSNSLGADSYLVDLNRSQNYVSDSAVFENFPVALSFQIFEDLDPGTTYFIRLQSTNENGSSGLIDPFDYVDTSFVTVPANPILQDPVEIGQTSASISWEGVIGAAMYIGDVSNNGFQTFINNYQAVKVFDNAFFIDDLSPGQEYQVRLKAANPSGKSGFSNVLTFRTVPPQPIARDATTVAATSFTANWDPSLGADFYILEVSSDDFVNYTEQSFTSPTPTRIEGLQEGVVYKYRVRAGNASGESPPSNEVEVRVATNSQTLSIINLDFEENFENNDTSIPIDIQLGGGQGEIQCLIRYKKFLENNWQDSLLLDPIGSKQYRFIVQQFMLDDVGFEFEVFVTDGITDILRSNNVIYRSFNNEQSNIIPLLNIDAQWQMFSIPYVLDDNLIETIFSQFGQLEYKYDWRLVHFTGTNYVDAGSGINRIELGKGYWVNFKAEGETQIKVGSGRVNVDTPFKMVLREGWNQIGNPYNVILSWDNVRALNQVSNSVDRLLTFDPQNKVFTEDGFLQPFEGAFVWSDVETELNVFLSSNSSFRQYAPTDNTTSFNIDQSQWEFPIELETINGSKPIASIGMNRNALMSKDPLDQMLVPRFIEYTEMFTVHDDYFYPYFQKDIRPLKEEESWLFTFSSNQVKGLVKLKWDNDEIRNSIKQLWIIDEESGLLVNMNQQNSISINLENRHQISIHLTPNLQTPPLPFKLLMGRPYPNPTRGLNSLSVLLPKSSSDYQIMLSLLTAEGRKIATIAEGQFEAGIYNFEVDFRDYENVSSGILIYKLAVSGPNGQTIFRKVILNK